MGEVLVLNAGYEPLHTVSVKHAIRMLVREVAIVEEALPGRTFGALPYPKVLRLVRYVTLKWRATRPPTWSKNRLLFRDLNTCGYCGDPANTVDHIVPYAKGGKSTWLNTVAACRSCNHVKRNRTPEEAGMKLHTTPYIPTWWDLAAGWLPKEDLASAG